MTTSTSTSLAKSGFAPVKSADLLLEEIVDRAENPIIFTGSARQYRADCKAGQFKIGTTKIVAPRLNMEVIAARVMDGALFGYPPMRWVHLVFVDPEGIVSTLLLKTESLDNFLELHRQALSAGRVLLGARIQAQMSRRASADGQGYFAVEFELVDGAAFASAIAVFRESHVIEEIFADFERRIAEPRKGAKQ